MQKRRTWIASEGGESPRFPIKNQSTPFFNIFIHENSSKWILWHSPGYHMLGWLWPGMFLLTHFILLHIITRELISSLLSSLVFHFHSAVTIHCYLKLCLWAFILGGEIKIYINENVKVSSLSLQTFLPLLLLLLLNVTRFFSKST